MMQYKTSDLLNNIMKQIDRKIMRQTKTIVPHEGMLLRYYDKNSSLYGELATAHRNKKGQWYVTWKDGTNSVPGLGTGLRDDYISDCWEVLLEKTKMPEKLIENILCRKQRKEIAASLYFSHFKLGKGFATVAVGKGTNEAGEKQTAWGVAFCCPEDQWDRKEGRMRARENLFSDIVDENKVMFATSAKDEMFLAAPHETCLLALQEELLVRRPSWFKKNRDKIETIARPRAKKKLGNLKPSVTINLAAVVSAVGSKGE